MNDTIIQTLQKELRFHARGLNIPEGAAEVFIDHTISALKKTFKHKSVITEADLVRETAKEIKKYSADLAYVFKNYDKIV